MQPQAIKITLTWLLLGILCAFAQESSGRKVVSRVVPEYPRVAKENHLAGVVKVEALVMPNGTVRTVMVRGGPPILSGAAADAVRKWKWTPSGHETREPVEVKFDQPR